MVRTKRRVLVVGGAGFMRPPLARIAHVSWTTLPRSGRHFIRFLAATLVAQYDLEPISGCFYGQKTHEPHHWPATACGPCFGRADPAYARAQ